MINWLPAWAIGAHPHWGILRSSLIAPPPEEGGAGVFKHQLPSHPLLGAEGGPYLPGTSSLHGCGGRAEKARRREAGANTESQVQCARKWHRPRGRRKGSSYSCCYKNKSQKGDTSASTGRWTTGRAMSAQHSDTDICWFQPQPEWSLDFYPFQQQQ